MNIYITENTDCKPKLLNFDFNKLNPLHYGRLMCAFPLIYWKSFAVSSS